MPLGQKLRLLGLKLAPFQSKLAPLGCKFVALGPKLAPMKSKFAPLGSKLDAKGIPIVPYNQGSSFIFQVGGAIRPIFESWSRDEKLFGSGAK